MKYLALKNICAGGNFIREGEYVELEGEVAAEYLRAGAIEQAESLELDKTQTDEPQAEGAAQELQPDIDMASSEVAGQQPTESESQAGQAEKTAPDEAAAKKNKGKK
ncbi:hypothetical protein [uncultured Campylobacter sp.]|uniref:hypothetical protein n=1 Tax=uncultured Campylobacter sp. TaxID=218934 RepID=UPI00260B9BA8|nr:hypothetical protein [uncultured Campylobacter sp.]